MDDSKSKGPKLYKGKKSKPAYNAYIAKARKDKFHEKQKELGKWKRQRKNAYAEAGIEYNPGKWKSSKKDDKDYDNDENKKEKSAEPADIGDDIEDNLIFPVFKKTKEAEDATSTKKTKIKKVVKKPKVEIETESYYYDEDDTYEDVSKSWNNDYDNWDTNQYDSNRKSETGTDSKYDEDKAWNDETNAETNNDSASINASTSVQKSDSKKSKKSKAIPDHLLNSRFSKEYKVLKQREIEKQEKREKIARQNREREEQLEKYAKNRTQKKKLMRSVNSKGQPKMSDKLEMLLGKLR